MIHWVVGHTGFALMVLTMIPWALARLGLYFWCYLLYAPLDVIARISARLRLEGSLKIVGAIFILTGLIIAYYRG